MPAVLDLPNVTDYLIAYSGAIQGKKNALLDLRTGSSLEIPGGMAALLWSRQSQRDRTLFNNAYTDSSTGVDLDRHIELKYKVERIQATYGEGYLILKNISEPGFGTVFYYKGTRLEVYGINKNNQFITLEYKVKEDVEVPVDAPTFTIPIEAIRPGTGVAIEAVENIRFTDEVSDYFVISYLKCNDGTDYESDNDYRARARDIAKNDRIGYSSKIIQTCKEAGAEYVVVLLSTAYGDDKDFALNYVYVADAGYSTSESLKEACSLALDDVRVAGADLQVLGMQVTPLTLMVNVYLYDNPDGVDKTQLNLDITESINDSLSDINKFWLFKLVNLQGAIKSLNPSLIQSVIITSSLPEPEAEFPAILPKYELNYIDVQYFKGDI